MDQTGWPQNYPLYVDVVAAHLRMMDLVSRVNGMVADKGATVIR